MIKKEISGSSKILLWNESTKNILVRNKDENITYKLEGYTKDKYDEFIHNLNDELPTNFKLSILFNNAENITQLGQHNTANITGINNRFKYYCNSCDCERDFQIQGQYREVHAECISCGYHASIIADTCSKCHTKRAFIKTLHETEYNCNVCEKQYEW